MAKVADILERDSRPVQIEPDAVYAEIGIRSHGRGVFHKEPVSGTQIGEKRVFEVVENALVLNIVFAWEQAIALTSKRDAGMIASHRFPMYRPRQGACDLRFVLQYLMSPRGKELLDLASPGGAGRNRTLGQHAFESLSIPCPPLDEQSRIADALQAWDGAISIARAISAKRCEEAELVRERLLQGVMHFEAVPLVELADVRTGLAKGKRAQGFTIEVPYLRVANVQDGRLDLSQVKKIEISPDQLTRYALLPGDVLMTEGGDFDKLGRGTVWNGEIETCLHQNHVFAVRPREDKASSGFIAAIAASEYGRNYFLSCAKRSTNLASINSTQLKALPIPAAPMTEQRRIASIVDVATRAAHASTRLVASLITERAAVMAALLAGRRRFSCVETEVL
jgi:type I restriction enzyme S subunit